MKTTKQIAISNYYKIINTLRARRMQLGYTRKKLSYLSGVSPSVISKLERGENVPQIDTAIALASALGLEFKINERQENDNN